MSQFEAFMKKNKIVKPNEFHAVTRSLLDENGKPLEWEFRHLTSKESEKIRQECTKDVPVTGKPNVYRPKTSSDLYIRKMIVASTVVPNLYDSELQDSYDVKTPEDLLMELVDDPGEYNDLGMYIQALQGFDVSFDDEVEEAKN